MERINAFYGYAAIAAIKIRQAQAPTGKDAVKPQPALPATQMAVLDAELAGIGDEALRQALRRLGAGALSRCKSSQQDQ